MIAKIGRSSNLYGALAYNHRKIEKEKGVIILAHKIIETVDGKYTVSQLEKSFEPYLASNRNTEKHTIHISLNPDPKDEVSDEQFRQMAEEYLEKLGYGNQPYLVFKHTDIDRQHIHIVSICVDEEGKKISDRFEKRRSMEICRDLEKKYDLRSAIGQENQKPEMIFRPVDYASGNCKSQMASVIRHLPKYYQYRTLGEYNALLSLFSMTAEKVEGQVHDQAIRGLLYYPLDGTGKTTGQPYKSSLFGKNAGLAALELNFLKNREILKSSALKAQMKSTVLNAMKVTGNEKDFKEELLKMGINTVIRRSSEGVMYGITFIDHQSRTVWNGSTIGKEFSSNAFRELWTVKGDRSSTQNNEVHSKEKIDQLNAPTIQTHPLFDFMDKHNSDQGNEGFIDSLGGLFSVSSGDEKEETEFALQMKRRKKKKR